MGTRDNETQLQKIAHMLIRRIALPLGIYSLAIVVGLAMGFIHFIPSWDDFRVWTAVIALIAAFPAGIAAVIGIWKHARGHLSAGWRVVLSFAAGFGLPIGVFVTALLCFVSLPGGFFVPRYKAEFFYPDYQTTIYLYDKSIFSARTEVRMRSSLLPITSDIGVYCVDWETIHLQQDGEWLNCKEFKLHLPTGDVLQLKPRFVNCPE